MFNTAPKIKILSILAKNSLKAEIRLFPYGAISQKNYSLSEIFWPGLYKKSRTENCSKNKLLAVSSPPPPKRARNIERDGSGNVNSVFTVE